VKKFLAFILAMVLISIACSKVAEVSTSGSSSSVGVQTLFSDHFTNRNSGWDKFQDITGVTDYSNVGYLIYVKVVNNVKWANPARNFQDDVRIEVDARKSEGPDNNAFGIICRYQDTSNFYYFYISSDGYGGIGKKEYGNYSILSSSDGKLHFIGGVNAGNATNHIRADCIGSTLTLYVNDNQVTSTTANAFTGGDVGLIARTYDGGGLGIVFTNFSVYNPHAAIATEVPSVTTKQPLQSTQTATPVIK
jgi:hypothetical protein